MAQKTVGRAGTFLPWRERPGEPPLPGLHQERGGRAALARAVRTTHGEEAVPPGADYGLEFCYRKVSIQRIGER